ncbi:MAG: glycosyltransferase family 4 protein [Candidatus Aureabacteria bacterium]|nr:glycosyltransferase family 4 protein [Candidatus Auribacterota bacterium]
MTASIHQLLEVFDEADAQGSMALVLRDIFRRWGFAAEIYAGTIVSPRSGARSSYRLDLPGDHSDILIFHYSIGAGSLDLFFRTLRRRVIVYHNVTPAEYFEGWDSWTALQCRRGRRELSRLLPTCDLALADSRFNAAELSALGFPRIAALPFPLNPKLLAGEPDPAVMNTFGKKDRANVLFVGRIAPNKRQDEIIRVFYHFQKYFQPSSRLILVGAAPISSYARALERLVRDLGLEGSVHFSGKISGAGLRAYYRTADLFLCLSDHEGFCVPLIESMYFKIPILAFAAGAIPETLRGAGILMRQKDPVETACLMNRLLADPSLRRSVLDSQARRWKEVTDFPYAENLRKALLPLM